MAEPLRDWQGHAVVVGVGGIGGALITALRRQAPGLSVHGAGRRGRDLTLDSCDDASLEAFGQRLCQHHRPLRLVIYAAGVLHGGDLQPEKRIAQLRRSALEQSFAVNAYGPALLARALEPCLEKGRPFHFASLSARVGSIGDNRLGGWYAYRAAKAAQNQLLHTLAVEWRRRWPLACVSLLHPGTTATELSAPFRGGVAPERLFSPDWAAEQLLTVLGRQTPEQSGAFLAWDGQAIPW
ncbi:MAG: SDR family NAD(P)-dependent oxidoreductase [Cyanobacteriota bacterium]|jgi:NAD(P)-dependent dehydrogenase (short-subunit alcohol dehydrogenase family)